MWPTFNITRFETSKRNHFQLRWKLERVKGIEPSSSAWKAEVISHYTTLAFLEPLSELESDYLVYKTSTSPYMFQRHVWV